MQTWADIDIDLPSGTSGEVRTTCPQCSASRKKSQAPCLAVNVDKGAWYCWHCGWHGGLSHRPQASALPAVSPRPMQPDAKKQAALRRVWSAALPLAVGDPVMAYLHQRGIALALSAMPAVVRYHRSLVYVHDNGQRTFHPAMIARVDNANGQGVSIHRTYLTADGHKADVTTVKKLMPPLVPGATRGGAIRLYPAGETLCVTEGIETALAVRLATGLPVWSTICAGGMAALVVPPEVALVVICADHDPAGLKAAKVLARRLLAEQRRVKMLTPETPGADWADGMTQGVRHA